MPVEIRELVIKTEIYSVKEKNEGLTLKQLSTLKQQIVQECLKTMKEQSIKNTFNR